MFSAPLDLRQLGRRRWKTLAPITCTSRLIGVVTVPAEFVTDLASVPRLPFAYMLTGDRARGPALFHDWLYQHPEFDDRGLADSVFDELMAIDQPELGYDAESAAVRAIMYRGVRSGGWLAWSRYTKRSQELNPEWSSTSWPEPAPQAP